MAIIKNSITFGSGFNITVEGPIDSRMVVETISDLTTVWGSDAPAYEGMLVSVIEDGNVYVLRNSDYSDINNWKKQSVELPNMDDYVTDDELNSALSVKENIINDLESIRSGAALGSTSLQFIPEEYVTDDDLNSVLSGYVTNETLSGLSNKVVNVESSLNNYYTIEQINKLIGDINLFNILVVDERFEIAGGYDCVLDVGKNTDIISGSEKFFR